MKHSDVEELLASYALDAVDPAEVVLVDAHLAECARCRAEVARHRELASMLTGSPEEPPAELWERISGALAEPDPDYAGGAADATPVAPITNLREAQRGRSKLGKGVLAALAAAGQSCPSKWRSLARVIQSWLNSSGRSPSRGSRPQRIVLSPVPSSTRI